MYVMNQLILTISLRSEKAEILLTGHAQSSNIYGVLYQQMFAVGLMVQV
jgi:hypothetical protein